MRGLSLCLGLLVSLATVAVAADGARSVWVSADAAEKNRFVSFRTSFDGDAAARPSLEIAASSVYRVSLNGDFVGWGPARSVCGYARKDRWPLPVRSGRNVLVIEVAGYGIESFQYNGDRPFLNAAVTLGGRTLAATPDGFEAVDIPRRRDTPVYSRQRGFAAEAYAVDGDWFAWCRGEASVRPRLTLVAAQEPTWLGRDVPYPEFKVNDAFSPTVDAKGGAMLQLKTLDSGLVGLCLECVRPGKIALEFDEAVGTNGVLDLTRNGDPLKSWHACYNRLEWDVKTPGRHRLETIEPYTMRYARVVTEGGEFREVRPYLRQVRNPLVEKAGFSCSDAELDRFFVAAKESLAQNAVDILTDCPSRERVGWLCDTFFSSETTAWLTGDFAIEREYLLNFTRTDDFGKNVPKGAIPGFMPSRKGGVMPTYMMWYVIQCTAAAARLGGAERDDFVGRTGPRIAGIFDWLSGHEKDGLLENLPGWVFIEWSKANDYTKGVNFPANMLWAMALERAGKMLGRGDYVAKAAAVRARVLALAYDGTCFHDQALRTAAGELKLTDAAKTETCQYYAFFTSLVDPAGYPALWKTVVDELGPNRRGHEDMAKSDAFIGFLLRLDILARHGCGAKLISDMKAYYGNMVAETGTFWEFADGHDSRCHAIGGYVSVLLVKAVFGIESIDWANRTLTVGRPTAGLGSARCELPVAEGRLVLTLGAKGSSFDLPQGWSILQKCDIIKK